MKGFEGEPNTSDVENEPVLEASAAEAALILAQKLMSYGSPGVPPEELAERASYLKEAEALLASADLNDEWVKSVLRESVQKAKEA
ncbi:MAG: hypothetical protein RL681_703 [Candidatus Parcubacteria bacterium]|jgi:transposase